MLADTSLRKNIIANFIGQSWTALMSLIFIPVYIKYMGIESYALVGIFVILQAWLSLLDLGITPTLGREMASFRGGKHDAQSIRDILRSVEVIGIIIAALIIFSIFISSDWLSTKWLRVEKLPTELVSEAISIMGFVIALGFIQGIYVSSIVGLQNQVLLNIANIIISTLRGLGTVYILIFISPTIKAFFIWQGFISIVSVIIFASIVYKSIPQSERPGRFSLKSLHSISRFASGMMTITILSLVLSQIDKILLSKILTLESFGYYTVAFSVANVLIKFAMPIDQAFYPLFVEKVVNHDETSLINSYHKGSQMISVFMGTAAIMLIFFGKNLLMIWTNNPVIVNHTTTLVAVLALGNLLNGIIHIPYHLQLAHAWTSLTIYINSIAILIIIPAIFYIAPKFGAIGVAWIWVALNAYLIITNIQLMHNKLLSGEKSRWYMRDVMIPIGTACISALLLHFIMPDNLNRNWQLIEVLFSASIIFISAILTAPALRNQFIELIKKFIFQNKC